MDSVSLWEAISGKAVSYPSLTQDFHVDVVIIGAGITGLTTAWHLTKAGKKVAVVEAHRVGSGTTGFSTGNLYVAVQPYYQNILAKFDQATIKTIAQSRQSAIDIIENIVQENNIKCHFARRPWYIYTNDQDKLSFLEKEINAFKQASVPISVIDEMPLALKFKKAAMIENQARFNPLQYVRGLAEQLTKLGCLIFENSKVIDIEEKTGCVVKTAKGKISAKKAVIATHTPIGIHSVQFRTAPYRSYAVAVHLKDKHYPEGHFWDVGHPHHATCTHSITKSNPEILIVAGSHHKTGQEPDALSHYKKLETFLKSHFPVSEIVYQWSAQHYHAADDVPYIGPVSRWSKHTYLAAGFFADGLIYGTLAGILIGDLILKKPNPWAFIYRSTRFTPIASAGFVAKENLNVLAQYYKDFPLRAEKNYKDIKAGEGKVVEIDREKWGVCRDEKGKLHVVSAVCTHMKCIVNWNDAEKSWDCPCHGSRFTHDGKVIEGPAIVDLKKKHVLEEGV